MKDLDFFQPTDLAGATQLLRQIPNSRLVGGGTELMVLLKDQLVDPAALIFLSEIPTLSQLRWDGYAMTMGAMTPLWQLERSNRVAETFPALHDAIVSLAVRPIRNQATLGGNLCLDTKCIYYNQSRVWARRLTPCIKAGGRVCYVNPKGGVCVSSLAADTVAPLLAYGATLTMVSVPASSRVDARPASGSKYAERQVPISLFFSADGLAPHNLHPQEILSTVHLSDPGPNYGVAYGRFSLRKALDFGQINIAAAIQTDSRHKIASAKLFICAIGPAPVIVETSLSLLLDQIPSPTLLGKVIPAVVEEVVESSRSQRLTDHLQAVLSRKAGALINIAHGRTKTRVTR